MLSKLRKSNEKGFTLIELMIVIAIIGVLAAIAIPNFIAYRDKAYCTAAEKDAGSIAAAVADYFSVPTRVTAPLMTDLGLTLSTSTNGDNTATITETANGIEILVTDVSGRCPTGDDYRMIMGGTGAWE